MKKKQLETKKALFLEPIFDFAHLTEALQKNVAD